MNAPALLDFPRIGPDTDDELLNSRLSGEPVDHYYARLTRIRASAWLDAQRDLEQAKRNGNNWETIYKLAGQERKARHSLKTSAELLHEALTAKVA